MLISRGVFPEMFPQRCGATEKRRGGLTPFARELALVALVFHTVLCDSVLEGLGSGGGF